MMLECEGYKMFKGSATIIPTNHRFPKYTVMGIWLFRPDTKCWYCNGRSYPENIIFDFVEENDN